MALGNRIKLPLIRVWTNSTAAAATSTTNPYELQWQQSTHIALNREYRRLNAYVRQSVFIQYRIYTTTNSSDDGNNNQKLKSAVSRSHSSTNIYNSNRLVWTIRWWCSIDTIPIMLSGLKDIIFGVRKKRVYPKLVTFGNVLVDFSFSIESNNQILKKYDFDSDVLGECSSEKLANVLRDAQET